MTAADLRQGDVVMLYNRKATVESVIQNGNAVHVHLEYGWYRCAADAMPQAFISVERDAVEIWRKEK